MSSRKPCMTNYNNSHITIIKDQDKNNSDNNMQALLNYSCSCTNHNSTAESSTKCSHIHKLERNNKCYYFNNNNNSTASAINSKLKRAEEAKYISKSSNYKNINIISDNIHDINWNMIMNKSTGMKDKKLYMVEKKKLLMQTDDEYYSYIGGGSHAPADHHHAEQALQVQVCSMCGDVGVAELLFLCTRCSLRHQHIYCSRSYPDMGGEASMCNWCLHEEDSFISSAAKVSEVNKTTACAYTNQMKEINHPAAHVNQASSLIKELNQVIGDDEDDAEHMQVTVKKGHSKAFEYLLLVAAQSLPLDNQVISDEVDPELNQANNTASMINITNQVISEASCELKQAVNHTASMVNFANPKILGSLVNKRNIINLDTRVNTGILDNNEVNKGSEKKLNINLSNRFSMGLEKNINLKKQNMDLHSKLNIRLNVQQKIDVGKRQRCSKGINPSLKGINPSLKCRKKGFQLSPSRPNYRRYKLLADVVC